MNTLFLSKLYNVYIDIGICSTYTYVQYSCNSSESNLCSEQYYVSFFCFSNCYSQHNQQCVSSAASPKLNLKNSQKWFWAPAFLLCCLYTLFSALTYTTDYSYTLQALLLLCILLAPILSVMLFKKALSILRIETIYDVTVQYTQFCYQCIVQILEF